MMITEKWRGLETFPLQLSRDYSADVERETNVKCEEKNQRTLKLHFEMHVREFIPTRIDFESEICYV
jgi:hypothetical protein